MMDDLVRREDVYNTLSNWMYDRTDNRTLNEVVGIIPSAQPEIIHCKDCRWWDKHGDYDNGYCMAAKHGYFSEHWEVSIRRTYKGDFYCADAER